MNRIAITECPRDAMQGLRDFIPTETKIRYLNLLLDVGFDRLDFGSFVSPKAIPQLADTAAVLDGLDPAKGQETALLAIIANVRGAEEASRHERIRILGFPFSVSETFQLRNTNSTREQSLDTVRNITDICGQSGKIPLVYLSMGFGNPYGDEWNEQIVADYAAKLREIGIRHIALADTTGSSSTESISLLYPFLKQEFPDVEWGLHLHSTPAQATEKIKAALASGCDRFDTAIRGFGGCPMAKDELTGNLATESLLYQIEQANIQTSPTINPQAGGLDMEAFAKALEYSHWVFGH